MTGEEMERAIEFLLQGQANHQMRLDELTEQLAETNKIVRLQAETQTSFIQIATRHIEAQGEVNASLRAAIFHTNERLDRLEAVVERYIVGRGGQA